MVAAVTVPREGYNAEWLALEDASGGRVQIDTNWEVVTPMYNNMFSALSKQWPQFEDEVDVHDEQTPSGAVRIYQPKEIKSASLPVVAWVYGGGLIAGTLDCEDAQLRHLAAKTPALVFCIDYPKVSDGKSKLTDALDGAIIPAIPWIRNRAPELCPQASTSVIIGGGSMGAGLALQAMYHYLAKGDSESITGMVTLFPTAFPIDYSTFGKYKDDFKSWKQYGNDNVPIISIQVSEYIYSLFDCDFRAPRHFPGLAEDEEVARFPPAFIVAAEKDCLRDDAFLLEKRMKTAGVPVKLDFYDDLPHYFHVFPQLTASQTFMDKVIEGLRFVMNAREQKTV